MMFIKLYASLFVYMIGVIISFKSNKLKSEIMRNQEKQKKN